MIPLEIYVDDSSHTPRSIGEAKREFLSRVEKILQTEYAGATYEVKGTILRLREELEKLILN